MKYYLPFFITLFISSINYCQINTENQKTNFDFELTGKQIPTGWNNFGSSDYKVALDSINVRSGKYAAYIEFNGGNQNFKAWGFTIPKNYKGKKITLEGYIKTEHVSDGYAGLWMRIDPEIAFDNMEQNGVKGTTNWTKYSLTLDMNPEKTTRIVVGGILVGKGKMWIDDLKVTVDGKDIQDLKPFERKIFPAEKDKEFDKGSKINSIPLDKNQMTNLKELGLIWGFLKYYHPSIASGQYNWDYELFRVLPEVLNAPNKTSRDEIIKKWIDHLGQYAKGKSFNFKTSNIKAFPDIDWIKNEGFTSELTNSLINIEKSKRPKEHYYIGLQPIVGNPDFKNENPYTTMKYPDAGFRLLALYRYWNIIQYYFPYKNLIEEDWKNVLEEFIPKFVQANNETEYSLAVLELIGRIHDTHANIWSNNESLDQYFGKKYAPIEITFIENNPIVTGYYNEKAIVETGMEKGDAISKINNRPVEEIIKEKLKYTPASNYPTQLRDLASNLLRTNDSTISIEYIRNAQKFTKSLQTFLLDQLNIKNKFEANDTCFKMINEKIAYINNGSLKKEYLADIWKKIQHTKGLIIDNRNYPSDFPIYALSNYLMPEKTPFVKFSNCSIEFPGLFTFTKATVVGEKNKNYYRGKVVILTNEISQSSSEFHAMAYRSNPNATVIGSTTAAADGNVSAFSLPGGISTMISAIGVYYPDGMETQRIGIVPNIEVKPTIQGVKKEQDELIEKAIEVINQQ
jgi:C-terminal processing protease CtpA/Prc